MSKQLFLLLIPISTIFFFAGCTAGLTEPEIDFKPPVYVEQMPAREGKKDYISQGSIFGQGENPLFSDHKAMNVNDIVRVVISETANSSNVSAKTLAENDAVSLGVGAQVPTFTYGGLNSNAQDFTKKLNNASNMSFSSGMNSTYGGSGSATKNATFTTTVSARVIKVLENGNYFIAGSREILVDEQKQIIRISGVIRPYDIDQTNSITSDQMSDAKILYKSEGDVDRSSQQGWGVKIVQSVWPF